MMCNTIFLNLEPQVFLLTTTLNPRHLSADVIQEWFKRARMIINDVKRMLSYGQMETKRKKKKGKFGGMIVAPILLS